MELPPVPEFDRLSPKGLEIMPHQSRFLEAVREGHRRFLLADEPGLGVRFTQQPAEMGPVTTAVFDDTCGNLIQIAHQRS